LHQGGFSSLNHVKFNRFNGSKAMVEVEKKISSVEPSKLGIKKAYTPPSLLEYGNIAKLTQGGAGTGSDGGTGTMMMMCL
jgi:hypothetical protein